MAIRISNLARHDLDEIRRYTLERWGENQWLKYYLGLVSVFNTIEQNLFAGRSRNLFMVVYYQ